MNNTGFICKTCGQAFMTDHSCPGLSNTKPAYPVYPHGIFNFAAIPHHYKIFTGIGSRDFPQHLINPVHKFACDMVSLGWILRTGDAPGADKAFRDGASLVYGCNKAEFYGPDTYSLTPKARESVRFFHPAPDRLGNGYGFKLMARNFYQVTGHPKVTLLQDNQGYMSKFVLAYSPGGFKYGGTSQALRIAHYFGVPIYNFYPDDEFSSVVSPYEKIKLELEWFENITIRIRRDFLSAMG